MEINIIEKCKTVQKKYCYDKHTTSAERPSYYGFNNASHLLV